MKKYLFALLLAFTLGVNAYAQNPTPAQMGITTANPNALQALDSGNGWSTLGTINPSTHVFTVTGGGGGGGSVTSFLTHALLISGTSSFSTQTLYQSDFYANSGGIGAAYYNWNSTSYCPLGTVGSPVATDNIVCFMPGQPSGTVSSTPGRYILYVGPSINVAQIGMAPGSQDNAPFIAPLMTALGSIAISGSDQAGGYDVIFPPQVGATFTPYYFSQALVLSRGMHLYCGGGTSVEQSVGLFFAAGIDGVVQEASQYTLTGTSGNGTVEGCGIYGLGHTSLQTAAPNVSTINGATLFTGDNTGQVPQTTWHNGDAIIVFPYFGGTNPISVEPAVPAGTTVTASGVNLTLSNPIALALGSAVANFNQATSSPVINFSAGDVMVVGNSTYTIVNSIGATPGNVLQGTTWLSTATNIANCVTLNTTTSTCVAQVSPPNVTADLPFTTNLKFWAVTGGTGGNSLTSTYTPAGTSAGAFNQATFGNGQALSYLDIYDLPLSQAFTVNTTSGSNTILVTGLPSGRSLVPGQIVYSDFVPFGTTVSTVRGSSLFTETGSNNFVVGDTIVNSNTGGTATYTFVSSLTGPNGQVLTGSSWAASAANLTAAIGDPINGRIGSPSSFTGTISGNILTVSGVTGTLWYGQTISGSGVTNATILSGSGTTWTIDGSPQTVGPVAMTSTLNYKSPVASPCWATVNSTGITFFGVQTGPFNGSTTSSIYTAAGTPAGSFDHAALIDQTVTLNTTFYGEFTQNATKTETAGKLWTMPAALRRDVTAQSKRLNASAFPIGRQMSCHGAFLNNTNCTFSSDEDNFFGGVLVGIWNSGNNYSGSGSVNEFTFKNHLADLFEGGQLGATYLNFNSHSGEGSYSTANILMNCTSQNGSFFNGGYFGGSGYPTCSASVGMVPATGATGPLVIGPQATTPIGSNVLTGAGLFGNTWKVTTNLGYCVGLSGGLSWSTAGCSNTALIWNQVYTTNNTWDLNLGIGSPFPVERYVSTAMGSTGNNGGNVGIEFPSGLLLWNYENFSSGLTNSRDLCMASSAPSGSWHKVGDFCFNTTAAAGSPIGWVELTNGATMTPVSAVSTLSGTLTASGSCSLTVVNGAITAKTGC